jgi:hypothetical protein
MMVSNFSAKYLRARSVEKKSSMAHILDGELIFFLSTLPPSQWS